jgi:VPDSG-CTERM motif
LLFSTSKKDLTPTQTPKHNMKSLKYIALIGLLCAGLSSFARANVTLIGDDVDLPNQGTGAELQAFIDLSGHTDATLCFKSDQENPGFTGTITFSVNPDNTLHVEWTAPEGQLICGFLTKDGAGTIADIFLVAPDQGPSGSADLTVPGQGAIALSHLTVFCCPGGVVPDGGTTVMLLGAGLGALGMVRRYLKR